MSVKTKPVIELDFRRYFPTTYDLVRYLDLAEDHEFKEIDSELSEEDLLWLEENIDDIDEKISTHNEHSNKHVSSQSANIYI